MQLLCGPRGPRRECLPGPAFAGDHAGVGQAAPAGQAAAAEQAVAAAAAEQAAAAAQRAVDAGAAVAAAEQAAALASAHEPGNQGCLGGGGGPWQCDLAPACELA